MENIITIHTEYGTLETGSVTCDSCLRVVSDISEEYLNKWICFHETHYGKMLDCKTIKDINICEDCIPTWFLDVLERRGLDGIARKRHDGVKGMKNRL